MGAVEGRGEKGIDEQASERAKQPPVAGHEFAILQPRIFSYARTSVYPLLLHPCTPLTPALGSKLLSPELILGVRLP